MRVLNGVLESSATLHCVVGSNAVGSRRGIVATSVLDPPDPGPPVPCSPKSPQEEITKALEAQRRTLVSAAAKQVRAAAILVCAPVADCPLAAGGDTLHLTCNDCVFRIGQVIEPILVLSASGSWVGDGEAGGTQLSWTITPQLPRGLCLDTSSGMIFGSPLQTVAVGSLYSLTARNVLGQSNVYLKLGVVEKPSLCMCYAHSHPTCTIGTNEIFLSKEDMQKKIKYRWIQTQTRAANFILRLRRRVRARPHMIKFLRRWKSLRYLSAVIATQKWIRRRLFRGQMILKFRRWHAHTDRTIDTICRCQRRWRYNALARGRSACAMLDHRITASVVKKALGKHRVSQLCMLVAMGVGKRRTPRDPLLLATLEWARTKSRQTERRNGVDSSARDAGTGANAIACGELVRDVRMLFRVGVESAQDTKLNHMGLPGRRGCGKGNTVYGLTGGGPWTFTVDPPLPPGMKIDTRNGCISGSPTIRLSVEPVAHTVTAANAVGKSCCQVHIQVVIMPEPPGMPVFQSRPWVVSVGTYAFNKCEIAGSTPFYVKIDPELPEGLELDASSGAISGWALEASRSRYDLYVSNDAGENIGALGIEVQIPPKALVYWAPIQAHTVGNPLDFFDDIGVRPKFILGTGYEYEILLHTRRRQAALRQRWIKRRARREVQQLLWHYLSRPLYHYIAKHHPLFGSSTKFQVTPLLPKGLEIDPDTGTIHGQALCISPEQEFTIRGSNASGSASISLLIEVLEAPTAAEYRGFVIPLSPSVASPHMAGKFEATTEVTIRMGYLRGEDIKIDAPRIRGTPPLLFSVLPPLPQGMHLNTDSGAIRGFVRSVLPCLIVQKPL
jgi:hypothetical protein